MIASKCYMTNMYYMLEQNSRLYRVFIEKSWKHSLYRVGPIYITTSEIGELYCISVKYMAHDTEMVPVFLKDPF